MAVELNMCLLRLITAVPILLGLFGLFAFCLYALGECQEKPKLKPRHPPNTVHAWRGHQLDR
jgi:hypothetical protein